MVPLGSFPDDISQMFPDGVADLVYERNCPGPWLCSFSFEEQESKQIAISGKSAVDLNGHLEYSFNAFIGKYLSPFEANLISGENDTRTNAYTFTLSHDCLEFKTTVDWDKEEKDLKAEIEVEDIIKGALFLNLHGREYYPESIDNDNFSIELTVDELDPYILKKLSRRIQFINKAIKQ